MHPYEISVLDESYLFFSLSLDGDASEYVHIGERCVFLLPSVIADFRVTGYEKNGKPLYDYYSAAVCAAAYLIRKRGLPLSEITFETPKGILEIFCTGSGSLSLKINKCKLLLSNHIEICGCVPNAFDADLGGVFRVVSIPFDAEIGKALAPRLVSAALPLPEAVILSTLRDNGLFIKVYSDHNPTPPSKLLCCAAAAFTTGRGGAEFSLENGSMAMVSFSTVEISLKPIFHD